MNLLYDDTEKGQPPAVLFPMEQKETPRAFLGVRKLINLYPVMSFRTGF